MNTELGFVLHPEKCIQCHACETACRAWRMPEEGASFRRVAVTERGAFPATTLRYTSVGCLHCAEPACAAACPAGAITKTAEGTVTVDRAVCIGCGACGEACPYGVPRFTADGRMHKCDLCAAAAVEAQRAPCARMCPTGALELALLTPEEKRAQEQALRERI